MLDKRNPNEIRFIPFYTFKMILYLFRLIYNKTLNYKLLLQTSEVPDGEPPEDDKPGEPDTEAEGEPADYPEHSESTPSGFVLLEEYNDVQIAEEEDVLAF